MTRSKSLYVRHTSDIGLELFIFDGSFPDLRIDTTRARRQILGFAGVPCRCYTREEATLITGLQNCLFARALRRSSQQLYLPRLG